jgi:glutathione S-transferase
MTAWGTQAPSLWRMCTIDSVPSTLASSSFHFHVRRLSLEQALLAPTVGGQGLFGELYRPEAERDQARIAELRLKAQWVAQVLGAVLGERSYFADELSIADIQLYAATRKSLEAGALGDAPKNLVEWCARMTERPSVAKAREENAHYRTALSTRTVGA